jgi:hypothetical protein
MQTPWSTTSLSQPGVVQIRVFRFFFLRGAALSAVASSPVSSAAWRDRLGESLEEAGDDQLDGRVCTWCSGDAVNTGDESKAEMERSCATAGWTPRWLSIVDDGSEGGAISEAETLRIGDVSCDCENRSVSDDSRRKPGSGPARPAEELEP